MVAARLSILTVRGIACLFLVAFHVVGGSSLQGLRLPPDSGWHYAMASFELLRMPIFSVLSGYLYATRRPDSFSLPAFARGKVRRIVLPLIFATLITFGLRSWVYGFEGTLLHALFFHYQHFWFLQSLLLIFTFIALWDVLKRPGWSHLAVAAFLAVLLGRSIGLTDFLSFDGAVYLLPFFVVGMILQMHPNLLDRVDIRFLAIWIVIGVLLAQQAGMLLGTTPVLRNSLPAAALGFGIAVLMLVYVPPVALLDRVGRYSYTIYIWHSLSGATVRTAINSIVILPTPLLFVLLLAAGIFIPMGLHRGVADIRVFSTLLAGLKYQPAKRRV